MQGQLQPEAEVPFIQFQRAVRQDFFVVQLSLNVFGATDVLPLTGVTFPFVSAGGSSIMSCWGLVAFIKAADERTYSVKR